jgi:hypothetical protein
MSISKGVVRALALAMSAVRARFDLRRVSGAVASVGGSTTDVCGGRFLRVNASGVSISERPSCKMALVRGWVYHLSTQRFVGMSVG